MEKSRMITYGYLEQVGDRTAEDFNGLLVQMTSDPDVMTTERLNEILAAGTKILTAEDEGRIVGTASVLVLRQMRWYKAWLEDIVVDEAYRGQGIARHLMEMSAQYAREKGCRNLNMTSKPGRENAWTLYESLGYKHRDTNVFRLDL